MAIHPAMRVLVITPTRPHPSSVNITDREAFAAPRKSPFSRGIAGTDTRRCAEGCSAALPAVTAALCYSHPAPALGGAELEILAICCEKTHQAPLEVEDKTWRIIFMGGN